MEEFIMAQENGRHVPQEDTIFGVSSRANKAIAERGRENVINATVGMLQDDEGKTIVLSSVDEVLHSLTPEEYAPYAPIGGIPAFKTAAIEAAFRGKSFKDEIRVVAAPGGTGALMLAITNYSKVGDKILIADWHWGPYEKIAEQNGRGSAFYQLFDEAGHFNVEHFRSQVASLLETQDSLLTIINSPAQNPTGYCLSMEEWKAVIQVLESQDKSKKIALVVDTAYIDFAGDEEEVRQPFGLFDNLQENIIVMMAYSFSKTFTFYGLRTGALFGLCQTQGVAEEFVRACEYTARAAWSNAPRIGQSIVSKVYGNADLKARLSQELADLRGMLLERGHLFESKAKAIGLEMLPFDGGFFAVVPCDDPAALGAKLEAKGVFMIPFGKGLRVSLASTPTNKCEELPVKILEAMQE